MSEKLVEELTKIIRAESTNDPAPTTCEVIKAYTNDPYHIDVMTDNGIITYVPCLFSNTVGHKGILIYINRDLNQPYAIIDNR